MQNYGHWRQAVGTDLWHSTGVAYVAARVCKHATLISIDASITKVSFVFIEALLAVADDVKRKKREGKAVVNMSWDFDTSTLASPVRDLLRKLDLRLYTLRPPSSLPQVQIYPRAGC